MSLTDEDFADMATKGQVQTSEGKPVSPLRSRIKPTRKVKAEQPGMQELITGNTAAIKELAEALKSQSPPIIKVQPATPAAPAAGPAPEVKVIMPEPVKKYSVTVERDMQNRIKKFEIEADG